MATHNDQDQPNRDTATSEQRAASVSEVRKAEREEVADMQERGTLTPESRKQGITSHLPESETAYMYRSEDDGGAKDEEGESAD